MNPDEYWRRKIDGRAGSPVHFKYDFVDARPSATGSGDERRRNSDVGDVSGFRESSSKAEPSPRTPIPTRKGSVFLNTSTNPRSRDYSMNGISRGKVLIFNQVSFDKHQTYLEREGTDRDVERLYETLPKLGFLKENINVYENMSAKEINREAVKLDVDKELDEADCLVVVILTHGEEADFLMAYDDKYHLYKFIENFTPTALNSMAGKPKLFIVQACRGTKLDAGVQLRAKMLAGQVVADSMPKDHVDSQGTEVFSYPEFADLLIVMSSHHGHYSFRNENGSWLIQELCNVIDSCDLESYTILDILTETNNAVAMRVSNSDGNLNNKKQIPSFYSTLTKRLFFKKKEE